MSEIINEKLQEYETALETCSTQYNSILKRMKEIEEKSIMKEYKKLQFDLSILLKRYERLNNEYMSIRESNSKCSLGCLLHDFTFLTEEQLQKLEILQKRGTTAPITDFSILLGCVYHDCYYYNNSTLLEDRAGFYWTSSIAEDKDFNNVALVNYTNGIYYHDSLQRSVGARPVLSYSLIRNICSNEVRGNDGILEVEYGEYPQKVPSKVLQDILEMIYNNYQSYIIETGKVYTVDSRSVDDNEKDFKEQVIKEYLFSDGKKYVRVKANTFHFTCINDLSNGETYKRGDYVWVEVQPIKWLIDEKSDIALSERILFAGVQFKNGIMFEKNYNGDFRTTDIKLFMDKYFSRDIIPMFSNEMTLNEDIKCLKKEKSN